MNKLSTLNNKINRQFQNWAPPDISNFRGKHRTPDWRWSRSQWCMCGDYDISRTLHEQL